MQPCGGNDFPDLYNQDDGSGRQRFAVQAVPNRAGQYYIIALGRPGTCGSYLSVAACASPDVLVRFATGDDSGSLLPFPVSSIARTRLLVFQLHRAHSLLGELYLSFMEFENSTHFR